MSSPMLFAGQKPTTPDAVTHFSATMRFKKCLRVVEQLLRFRADLVVGQDLRIAPGELPGLEERRPIDIGHERREIEIRESPRVRGSSASPA